MGESTPPSPAFFLCYSFFFEKKKELPLTRSGTTPARTPARRHSERRRSRSRTRRAPSGGISGGNPLWDPYDSRTLAQDDICRVGSHVPSPRSLWMTSVRWSLTFCHEKATIPYSLNKPSQNKKTINIKKPLAFLKKVCYNIGVN